MNKLILVCCCALIALSLWDVREVDSVACTAPDTPAGCTDCTDPDNAASPDCAATTTLTTEAPGPNRRLVRISNLSYTVIRRISRNGGSSSSSSSGTGNSSSGNSLRRNSKKRSNRSNRRTKRIRRRNNKGRLG